MALPTLPKTATSKEVIDTPSWLLMGGSGTGKTHSITTLIRAGLEVFMLATEPDATSVVQDAILREKLPLEKFHWHGVKAANTGISSLLDMAKKVKIMDFESVTKLKSGIGKESQNQFIEVLQSIENFVDDKDGKPYGNVTTWGPDRVFVIDSLSGLNTMAWKLTIGNRPTAAQGEWGIAQNILFDLINELVSTCQCYFVLLAHVDRETDEVTGGSKIMVASLGKKLAPRLTPIFSEVIMAVREGSRFTWSTIVPQADLKTRALEWAANLPPSFEPLVAAHQKRLKAVTG